MTFYCSQSAGSRFRSKTLRCIWCRLKKAAKSSLLVCSWRAQGAFTFRALEFYCRINSSGFFNNSLSAPFEVTAYINRICLIFSSCGGGKEKKKKKALQTVYHSKLWKMTCFYLYAILKNVSSTTVCKRFQERKQENHYFLYVWECQRVLKGQKGNECWISHFKRKEAQAQKEWVEKFLIKSC